MKLVLLFGPQAVGKMTVGQELEKETGLKLFHNHMTIEMLEPFFGFSEDMWKISDKMREEVFRAYSKTAQEGMIFTFVWVFNKQEDWDMVEKIRSIFESEGAEVYYVELEADLDARLERNRTPNRLEHKPTKRNVEDSEKRLIQSMDDLRLNSEDGEIDAANYVKINNSHLSPKEVVDVIRKKFDFEQVSLSST
ncbi:AAA family ATPase [Halobacillus litoralis]|uniref:AAA family ATPase n=1 Tax=Halobacillus litoralis TaxID=45668 RepID=UPI001CD232CA|nr:AAA family ATPase [Halobacillus litoralis]MCA0969234.1 AAA family ATPase [Halobacillus litoralis]